MNKKLIEILEIIKSNGCEGINCSECPLESDAPDDKKEDIRNLCYALQNIRPPMQNEHILKAKQSIIEILTKLEKETNKVVMDIEIQVNPYFDIKDRKIHDVTITLLEEIQMHDVS